MVHFLGSTALGQWVASGQGLIKEIAERDIEFEFPDRDYAQHFADACAEVPGVRVLCLESLVADSSGQDRSQKA